MYALRIQEHNFICTVCYYKNGNENGSDLVLIVGVLSYAVFLNGSFLKEAQGRKEDIFQSEPPFTFIVSNTVLRMCRHADKSYTGNVRTNV